VSLDRADAIIEGAAPFAFKGAGVDFPRYPCAARSRSKPIRENRLDKAGNPVGIKSLIADLVLSVLLPCRHVLQESSLSTYNLQLSAQRVHNPNRTVSLPTRQVIRIEHRSAGTPSSLQNKCIPKRNLIARFDGQGPQDGFSGPLASSLLPDLRTVKNVEDFHQVPFEAVDSKIWQAPKTSPRVPGLRPGRPRSGNSANALTRS
jgi:hypothetical protein